MHENTWRRGELNPFTTENPFLGKTILGFSIGRSSGALKGLSFVLPHPPKDETKKKRSKTRATTAKYFLKWRGSLTQNRRKTRPPNFCMIFVVCLGHGIFHPR